MPSFSSVLPLLLVALQGVSAEFDLEARCDETMYFCLTSFLWCDSKSADPDCYWPENTYPMSDTGTIEMGAVLWDEEYELSWIKTDEEYPVQITWSIGVGHDDETETLRWRKNFTNSETSFNFKFSELAEEIDDVDPLRVMGQAQAIFNGWEIRQPGREYPDVEPDRYDDVFDYSSQFSIFSNQARPFLEAQREIGINDMDEMNKRWRLGVGIGVGLGVPIFMAASFVGGLFWGKRRGGTTKQKVAADVASE